MNERHYSVIIEPETEPGVGGYNVRVPALPGCFTQGDTIEEALEMARDAIFLYIESLLADGAPIPIEQTAPRVEIIQVPISA